MTIQTLVKKPIMDALIAKNFRMFHTFTAGPLFRVAYMVFDALEEEYYENSEM